MSVLLWELLGIVLGLLMCGSSLALAVFNWRDWREAEGPLEWAVGRRQFEAACLRSAAKLLIEADLVLILVARPGVLPVVRRFLIAHPLTLFVLLLAAMALLTANNAREWYWRTAFRAKLRSRDR